MAAEATPAGDGWEAVRLTEARQVLALMGRDRDDRPPAAVGVRERYEELRAAGMPSAAVDYLGHALPRLEAVAWAARVVEDAARAAPPSPRARHAVDVALRWLGDRTDAHRRAAREAADAVGKPVAERFLGLAVFYSGGSIAGPLGPPVPPPEHAAARYAVAAIGDAARRGADAAAAFDRALALGEAVAARGLQALAR